MDRMLTADNHSPENGRVQNPTATIKQVRLQAL